MEIVEGIVYVFATIVTLGIGFIVMVTMPNKQYGETGITEKQGYIRKIVIACLLQILGILVLLDLWNIVEIF